MLLSKLCPTESYRLSPQSTILSSDDGSYLGVPCKCVLFSCSEWEEENTSFDAHPIGQVLTLNATFRSIRIRRRCKAHRLQS